ncbi:MAG TPA: acyl-CoA dehydrogenase family protein [Candidatus Bipolaricaulota bacterium]
MNPAILDWLLTQRCTTPHPTLPTLSAWKRLFDAQSGAWAEPVDRAIVGGFLADRVAYAFAAGYQSALQRLVPTLPLREFAALCVTEAGGGHPRDIQTKLEPCAAGWTLNGCKRFVSCAHEAHTLLIVASMGRSSEGKNQLKLVSLRNDTPGVSLEPMDPLSFVPEISHAQVRLEDVRVTQSRLLPGDGYLDYVKPFRTIEDVHVLAAVLAHLFRVASSWAWPGNVRARLVSLLTGVRALATCEPSAPAVHVALAGALEQTGAFLHEVEPHWQTVEPAARSAWQRDRALLGVAQGVRDQRLKAAWRHFGQEG